MQGGACTGQLWNEKGQAWIGMPEHAASFNAVLLSGRDRQGRLAWESSRDRDRRGAPAHTCLAVR